MLKTLDGKDAIIVPRDAEHEQQRVPHAIRKKRGWVRDDNVKNEKQGAGLKPGATKSDVNSERDCKVRRGGNASATESTTQKLIVESGRRGVAWNV